MLYFVYRITFPAIFLLLLNSCLLQSPKIVSVEKNIYELRDSIPEDAAINQLLYPYKKEIDKEMNEVIAFSETSMMKGQPEGILGNFVADVVFTIANKYYVPEDSIMAHFCMLNNGGLRTALPEGEITKGKIFELMPFENEIVILTLTGENVQKLLNYIAAADGVPVSGIKIGIKDKKITRALIQDIPFDPAQNYKVITSDYLSHGGDRMIFFNEPMHYEKTGIKLRDAIIEYIINESISNRKIHSQLDGRVYHE
jgi:2',3'-cyclic-nucleotide 2'-phosphodiesterase (5'-nucleotidase family)